MESEGQKVLGPSMIIGRLTATMWALWPLILVRAMGMEGGYSFFNYMSMEPLKIGPRIQKSDTNFRRALERPGVGQDANSIWEAWQKRQG